MQDIKKELKDTVNGIVRRSSIIQQDKPLEIDNQKIKKLNLSNKVLLSVPTKIYGYPSLEVLDLSRNSLTSLPAELVCLVKLQVLNVSYNQIRTFPTELSSLQTLRQLSLRSNKLTHIPDFVFQLTSLTSLELQENQIEAFPPELCQLARLESLSVHHNSISTIPLFLSQLSFLQYLNVAHNKIQSFPTEVANLPRLKELVINNNTLPAVPKEILNTSDSKRIISYFRGIHLKAGVWKEMKLLIVGEEGVGKTSLVECLQSVTSKLKNVKKNMSTDGIEMHDWKLSDFKLRCWDFGGQTVFYPTHEVLQNLVFNMAKKDESRIDYWLRKIRAVTGKYKPIVFLVGTHYDEFAVLDLASQKKITADLEKFLQNHTSSKYNIIDTIHVSCSTGKGIKELREKIKEEVLRSVYNKNLFPIVPSSYIELSQFISRYLEEKDTSMLIDVSWDQFRKWGNLCGLQDDDVIGAAQFLHDTGVIIHFHNVKGILNNVVILNPQSLAKVMADLISFKNNWKDGNVTQLQWEQIWKNYSKETQFKLVSILEKFEVAFRIKGENTLVVPSLLVSGRPMQFEICWPSYARHGSYQIGRVYTFPFVPLGFFAKLTSVSIHHFGASNGIKNTLFSLKNPAQWWKNGLYLEKLDFERALIEFETLGTDNYQLVIYVRAPNSKSSQVSLMQNIVLIVDSLLESYYSYEDLRNPVVRHVPCPHCISRRKRLDQIFLFTYEYCMKAVTSGVQFVRCPDSVRMRIEWVCPDIALNGIEVINYENIERMEKIGEGLDGVVHKGLYEEKEITIKEMIPDFSDKNVEFSQFEKFKREVQVMAHPNIVKLYGVMYSPSLSIVTEYFPMGTLSQGCHIQEPKLVEMKQKLELEKFTFLKDTVKTVFEEDPNVLTELAVKKRELERREAEINDIQSDLDLKFLTDKLKLKIALDIAKALRYLHSFQPPIIHQDICSSNIYLASLDDENAEVLAKIGDFGGSRISPSLHASKSIRWQWMAPELIECLYDEKADYDHKADVYSFGLVLWELVTNFTRSPFVELANKTKEQLMKDIVQGFRPEIPLYCNSRIAKLIKACWRHDPAKRPPFTKICQVLCNMLGIENENPENKEYFTTSSAKKTEYQVPFIKTINTSPSKISCLTTINADQLAAVTKDGYLKIFNTKSNTFFFQIKVPKCKKMYSVLLVKQLLWISAEIENGTGIIVVVDPQNDFETVKELAVPGPVKQLLAVQSPLVSLVVWSLHIFNEQSVITVWDLNFSVQKIIQVEDIITNMVLVDWSSSVWIGGHKILASVHLETHELSIFGNHTTKVHAITEINRKQVWVSHHDNTISIWNPKKLVKVSLISLDSPILSIRALGPFVAAGAIDTILFYNPSTLECIQEIFHDGHISLLYEISNTFWTISTNKTISFWSIGKLKNTVPNVERSEIKSFLVGNNSIIQ